MHEAGGEASRHRTRKGEKERMIEIERIGGGYTLAAIEKIIVECEEIQHSQESAYTKERAKVNAYKKIKELIGIEVAES